MRRAWSERVFAALVRCYPREFRERYGVEMQEFYRDALRENGARAWMRAIPDALLGAARERAREAFSSRPERSEGPAVAVAVPHLSYTTTGDGMLQSILQDLSFATRIIRKNPLFTGVAVLVIALGTGAVSTIFSIANAVVLQPVPGVTHANELVNIERMHGDGSGSLSASYPYYEQLSQRSRSMSGIAAWSMVNITVSTGGEGVAGLGNIVSGNYFRVLDIKPFLGRFFSAEEGSVRGASPVVVLSHAFWLRRFGGDSGIVGKPVLVNGRSYTVIGVSPARFSGLYPMLRTDAFVPLMMQEHLRPGGRLDSQGSAWLELFGRLAPGTSREAAAKELAAVTKQVTEDPSTGTPSFMKDFTGAKVTRVSGLPSDAAGAVMGFFAVLLVLAGVVLLIASVNVASMLLARSVVRRREIAVRVALGAGRARLIRQLLTESTLLFVLGGGAGALLAEYGTRVLARIELPVDVPLVLDVSPDARVLGVTLFIALVTGIVFGLAPAMQGTRQDIATTLRASGAGAGQRRSRMRNALVIGQVAMSLLLLTVSGLFVRALDKGRKVEIGFDATNVAVAALDVSTSGYDSTRSSAFYGQLAERVSAIPGVTSVGFARVLPLSMNNMGTAISIPAYTPPGQAMGADFNVTNNLVDAGFFTATRLPMARGRALSADDRARSAPVAVVNEAFAKQYFPNADAVGQAIGYNGASVTIVGVARNAKNGKLNEDPEPFLYLPMWFDGRSATNILVRTAGDASVMGPAITRAMHEIDPILPPPTYTTLQKSISVALLPQRFAVAVTGALGILGLLLAAVGLYGVLSFSIMQRTREIGVRVALGALRMDVFRLVVGEGMTLVGIGIGIGLALSLGASQALRTFLFGVSPADPVALLGTVVLLAATALVACYIPARRAAGVEPIVALRQE
ncbi:MAG: permease [Gemmatimonadetes bacterium]|nr:permease [Gemmatimonadota bacterium]